MPISAFTAAAFNASFYDQLKYIAHDEEEHVLFPGAGLKAAGTQPVAACICSFPMTTLDAAPAVTNKAYLTAAGSILVTEAIHQAVHRNAISEIIHG